MGPHHPLEADGLLPLAVGVGRAQHGPTTTVGGGRTAGDCSELKAEGAELCYLSSPFDATLEDISIDRYTFVSDDNYVDTHRACP